MKSTNAVDIDLSTTFCGSQPFKFVLIIHVNRHLLSSLGNCSAAQQLSLFSAL